MAAVGGPIESVSLRGRLFAVAADADTNTKLGGFENDVKPNGNGTARMIKSRVPWSITGLKVAVDRVQSDQEFLKQIADGQDFVPVAVTFVDGFVYQGRGIITGEVQYSSNDAVAELNLMGPGEATQQ